MFFNRTRKFSAPTSDPYTNLPKSPRARRATGTFDCNPTQPRDIIHPKNKTPPHSTPAPSCYVPPSAATYSPKRHSDPSPVIPPTISYPHRTPTRERLPSLPSTLPSDVQVQIDIEQDSISKASGQVPRPLRLRPPQRHQLNQSSPGGRDGFPSRLPQPQFQRGRGEQRSERPHPSSSVPPSSSPHRHPRPASEPNIKPKIPPCHHTKKDPRLLLGDLRLLLRPSMHHLICDHLDVDDLLALHDRDLMERDERAAVRARVKQCREVEGWEKNDGLTVFGVKLREVSMYASSSAILGGYEHDLPIVVFACVEELYRTGIYQKNLFRALPYRPRLLYLINTFDAQPHFGVHTPLHTESMPDVCALLSTYLSSLPEPVLSSALFEAVWAWCVQPSLERDEESAGRLFAARDEVNESQARRTSVVVVEDQVEARQINLARLLLNLLPSANFSLMVYLLAFFSQVPLAPENGITVEDLGRIFGGALFGGSVESTRRRKSEGTIRGGGDGDGRAGRTMVWFLTRWRRISEGLFEDEGHAGAEQAKATPRKSVDVGGLGGWMPSQDAPGDFFGSSPALSSSHPVSRPGSFTDSDDSVLRLPLPPTVPLDLKGKAKVTVVDPDGDFVSPIRNDRVEVPERDLMPSDGLFEMDGLSFGRASDSESTSLCSTSSLSERLLDISLPPSGLLNSNIAQSKTPDGTENASVSDDDDDDDDYDYTGDFALHSPQPSPKAELAHARHQVLCLESELERSETVVADAIQQTFDARDKTRLLEERIRALETGQEKAAAMVAALEGENETLKRRLEVVERERDKAWELVGDVRRLVGV